MSIIEDLRNTEITDTAFYLFFVLALTAPGTAYALYFYLDVFKELDSWKAFFYDSCNKCAAIGHCNTFYAWG